MQILNFLSIPFVALWGAIGWRLRGGAFDRLTGIKLGTQMARLLFGSVWMVLPAVLLDWRALLLIPALWVGLAVNGWGEFMDLGRDGGPTHEDRRVFFSWAVARIWGHRETWLREAFGLMLCGLVLVLPSVIVASLWCGWNVIWLLLAGAWMPGAYALAYAAHLPCKGKFIDTTTVWGEVFFGIVLAPAVFLTMG